MNETNSVEHTLELTSQIVEAHVSRNPTNASELPEIIQTVHAALVKAEQSEAAPIAKVPAVPVKNSVFEEHLVCLECGKPFRMLRRHLLVDHNLSPQAYRERFQLLADYPLIAPEYSKARSEIALQHGLGHWRRKSRKKGI